MIWTVLKLFVGNYFKIRLRILIYDLWKKHQNKESLQMQSGQYFLVQFVTWPVSCHQPHAFVLGLSSCHVRSLGLKKYCVYESTKEARRNSGAGKPGHSSPAAVNAGGWLWSKWESTARAGQHVKKSTDFSASFDVEENELAGTQTSTLIVMFLFLASGTYNESLLAS